MLNLYVCGWINIYKDKKKFLIYVEKVLLVYFLVYCWVVVK